ncbi:MAG: hypothetical protein Q7T51_04935, partial [Candidatus Moranbacteria bacterium]|nr:hypothetical protein [Candidatus Moranbacteria bacterium]
GAGQPAFFCEKVENLSWYVAVRPFSFLPLFFWEKKNGVLFYFAKIKRLNNQYELIPAQGRNDKEV